MTEPIDVVSINIPEQKHDRMRDFSDMRGGDPFSFLPRRDDRIITAVVDAEHEPAILEAKRNAQPIMLRSPVDPSSWITASIFVANMKHVTYLKKVGYEMWGEGEPILDEFDGLEISGPIYTDPGDKAYIDANGELKCIRTIGD